MLHSTIFSKTRLEVSPFVLESYIFAKEAHKGQKRLSGEEFITHPVAVMETMRELGFCDEYLSAALLHDVLEDTSVTYLQILERFGYRVASLVDAMSEDASSDGIARMVRKERYYQKFSEALVKYPHLIVLKLADRQHNLSTINSLVPRKQFRYVRETRDVFLPWYYSCQRFLQKDCSVLVQEVEKICLCIL